MVRTVSIRRNPPQQDLFRRLHLHTCDAPDQQQLASFAHAIVRRVRARSPVIISCHGWAELWRGRPIRDRHYVARLSSTSPWTYRPVERSDCRFRLGRPSPNIDFAASQVSGDLAEIRSIANDILSVPTDDGITFDLGATVVEEIREHELYPSIRAKIAGSLWHRP